MKIIEMSCILVISIIFICYGLYLGASPKPHALIVGLSEVNVGCEVLVLRVCRTKLVLWLVQHSGGCGY